MKAAAATAGMPPGQRALRHVGDRVLGGVGLLVMLLALAALAALLYDILHDGLFHRANATLVGRRPKANGFPSRPDPPGRLVDVAVAGTAYGAAAAAQLTEPAD